MTIDLLPKTDDLAFLDATAQAALVTTGEASAVELVDAAIERIERLNPRLNAVVTEMFESRPRCGAGAARRTGRSRACRSCSRTSPSSTRACASPRARASCATTSPTHDQELTVRLKRAGLVIIGKTNTCEFGMRPTCEPALFGATRNPWDTTRTPGGSSGGSAAAVASGMVPMGHGNDAGGSLRFPASCCGLFALKPTRARVPARPRVRRRVQRPGRRARADPHRARQRGAARRRRRPRPRRPLRTRPRPTGPSSTRSAPTPAGCASRSGPSPSATADCTPTARPPSGPPRGCASRSATRSTEAAPPALARPELGAALEAVYGGAVAWILGYWVQKLGREPAGRDRAADARVLASRPHRHRRATTSWASASSSG